ncbi:hypothetical protein ACP4OV_001579 [Aristida adscensionis]
MVIEMTTSPPLRTVGTGEGAQTETDPSYKQLVRWPSPLSRTSARVPSPTKRTPKMSHQINEEHDDRRREVQVVDVDPAAATPRFSASGRHGFPVLITPAGAGGAPAPAMSTQFQGFFLLNEERNHDDDPVMQRKKWFKEFMKAWMTVLASITASVTYQAALNPPGGFWQADDGEGHHAGDPVLRDKHPRLYQAFYYLNATSFVTSLMIMVLSMSERFYHTERKTAFLMATVFVNFASLVGAYVAGSTGTVSSSVYVIVISCIAVACIIYVGELMATICFYVVRTFPCMAQLAKNRWFPVPQEWVEHAIKAREERRMAGVNSNRAACSTCSPCCARPRVEA